MLLSRFSRSLVTKMATCAAMIVAVLIAIAVGSFIAWDKQQASANLSIKLTLMAQMIQPDITQALWRMDPEVARENLRLLTSVEDFAEAVILDEHGEIFVRLGAGASPPPHEALMTAEIPLVIQERNSARRPIGTFMVSLNLARTMDKTTRTSLQIGGIGLVVLVLVVLMTVYLTRGIAAPLSEMTKRMRTLAVGTTPITLSETDNTDEIGCMAAVLDACERANTELHTAKEQAEQAVAAKAKFMASASHDLRQPVQSLMMLVEVLRIQARAPDVSITAESLENVTATLKELLDNLLDVSRLDAGSVVSNPEVHDLGMMLRDLDLQFSPVARNRGLDFRIDGMRAHIRTDRVLLMRMLGNLIDNAIRYTPSGGVTVACAQADGHLNIEIRDTGIGIPEDRLAAVWEEFYQVGNQERNRDNGVGLGLSIVKRLSAVLKHPVTLDSKLDVGTCFTISVPFVAIDAPTSEVTSDIAPEVQALPKPTTEATAGLDRDAADALEPEPSHPTPATTAPPPAVDGTDPAPETARINILVVDDDPVLLLGLRGFLVASGYDTRTYTDATACLRDSRDGILAPDLIIVDYNLPTTTGPRLIRDLRETLGRTVPAAILTGDAEESVAEEARVVDADIAYKPLSPNQMNALIRRKLPPNARPPHRVATAA